MRNALFSIILAASVVSAGSSVSGAAVDSHVLGRVSEQLCLDLPAGTVAGTFQQPVEHSGVSASFSQRYWVNSANAHAADAPVILHICGEADCTEGYFLNDSALDWARELGGRVVYLEHRFYGESVPAGGFASLTLENVLEDLANFQRSISAKDGWTGKWIVVGGSYAGTVAALYRQKHPELVVGALASSAPMISGQGSPMGGFGDSDPWTYQACTELGFWTAAGEAAGSPVYYPSESYCRSQFPGAKRFDKDDYNRRYNQPFLSGGPSNILFTYGTDDVWTILGLSQQTNSNSAITINLIDGAMHHYDLNAATPSDSAAVLKARQDFLTAARSWLR